MMSSKRHLLLSVSGAIVFALLGACIYFIGANFSTSGLLRTIGVLMIVGGGIAVVFLWLSLPRR